MSILQKISWSLSMMTESNHKNNESNRRIKVTETPNTRIAIMEQTCTITFVNCRPELGAMDTHENRLTALLEL
ncbi:hypothetical protein PENFLA_c082G07008 [Penicillium flavigenum]|uniref:Uncharacterized protein n=1 Tax=Penicillium flavigenum TaxID=254877 RepID=A0A1V6SA92_9EURO|nr:hypothetical protein PENFLA_c082G07008 [Penicillium flavigenum]